MSNGTVEEPTTIEDKATARKISDPELKAMAGVIEELDELNAKARQRVLRWANDRYGVIKDKPDFSDI
jgi:hypothetical protein